MYNEKEQNYINEQLVVVEYVHINKDLHQTVIRKYLRLAAEDIFGTLFLVILFGVLAIVFHNVLRIVMIVLAIAFLAGFGWNLVALLQIVTKKYKCSVAEVCQIWEEDNTIQCRFTPDVYKRQEFSEAVNLKRHIRQVDAVREGSRAIVVSAKNTMFLYIFDYVGPVSVIERECLNIKASTRYGQEPVYCERDKSQIYVEHPYFGDLTFQIYESEQNGEQYNLREGFRDVKFGGNYVEDCIMLSVHESRLEDVLSQLQATFEKSDEIMQDFYQLILEKCTKENMALPENVVLDETYIRDGYCMEEIDIQVFDMQNHGKDDVEMLICGIVENHKGEKQFYTEIEINCMSMKIEYRIS